MAGGAALAGRDLSEPGAAEGQAQARGRESWWLTRGRRGASWGEETLEGAARRRKPSSGGWRGDRRGAAGRCRHQCHSQPRHIAPAELILPMRCCNGLPFLLRQTTAERKRSALLSKQPLQAYMARGAMAARCCATTGCSWSAVPWCETVHTDQDQATSMLALLIHLRARRQSCLRSCHGAGGQRFCALNPAFQLVHVMDARRDPSCTPQMSYCILHPQRHDACHRCHHRAVGEMLRKHKHRDPSTLKPTPYTLDPAGQ